MNRKIKPEANKNTLYRKFAYLKRICRIIEYIIILR